jgi:single-strand DNA-binding protein
MTMARSYSRLTLIGHLGHDPEAGALPDGTPVCRFSVAATERWTTPEGDPQERTTWYRVSAFDRLAAICLQYLHTGSCVYVEGSLSAREYADREGTPRTSLEVRARELRLLDLREDDKIRAARGPAGVGAAASSEADHDVAPLDDDVPF